MAEKSNVSMPLHGMRNFDILKDLFFCWFDIWFASTLE